MQKIENDVALNMISNEGISYVIEADSLRYLIGDDEKVSCYKSEDGKLLVTHYENDHVNFITIITFAPTFEIEKLKDWLKATFDNLSILINVKRVNDDFKKILISSFSDMAKYKSTMVDYAFVSERSTADIPNDIKILDESFRDDFEKSFGEKIENRPSGKLLFDMFVRKKQGYILGAFEGSRLVGYLSFNEISSSVFDVDYIYVLPSERLKGFGRKMADAYVHFSEKQKHIAYWSNALNNASINTALKVGFELIREVYKFC